MIRRIAGAVPEIIFVLSPQVGRQEATFVAADLAEVAQVIPLRRNQVGLERAAELHEHFIERFLVRDLRKAEHLAAQRCGLRRIMPGRDFVERMCCQIGDGKTLFEFAGSKSLAQILAEGRHAIVAVAIVPVEVIRDETVHAARDAATNPGLQHLAPVRVVQTGPILAHPADAVILF